MLCQWTISLICLKEDETLAHIVFYYSGIHDWFGLLSALENEKPSDAQL
jgi:hypothetical protein